VVDLVAAEAVDLAAEAAVTWVEAAATAAADTGKFAWFSHKRPVCFGRRAFSLCAQHGRTLTGVSPVTSWPQ
jgi:hypothetical protein